MTADEKPVQVVEDEEVPVLEAADNEEPTMDGRGGKVGKRYAKAMAKMGLKPEPNIVRVQVRKHQGMSFGISKPEVYRFPGTNTFVIFGDTQVEDAGLESKAARTVVGGAAEKAPEAAPAAAADAADEDEDAGTLQDKEITVVMSQANVSRGKAIKALKNNNGDIVNAIMELTM